MDKLIKLFTFLSLLGLILSGLHNIGFSFNANRLILTALSFEDYATLALANFSFLFIGMTLGSIVGFNIDIKIKTKDVKEIETTESEKLFTKSFNFALTTLTALALIFFIPHPFAYGYLVFASMVYCKSIKKVIEKAFSSLRYIYNQKDKLTIVDLPDFFYALPFLAFFSGALQAEIAFNISKKTQLKDIAVIESQEIPVYLVSFISKGYIAATEDEIIVLRDGQLTRLKNNVRATRNLSLSCLYGVCPLQLFSEESEKPAN